MSFHTFSNLAVQDITDESAAMNSGGAPTFFGFDDDNLAPDSGPQQLFGNVTPAIGAVVSVSFTGALSIANNRLDRFALSGAGASERYRVRFFADLNFTQDIGGFGAFNNRNQSLPSNLQNRIGSVRIQRVA
jgi:hypothetical protein